MSHNLLRSLVLLLMAVLVYGPLAPQTVHASASPLDGVGRVVYCGGPSWYCPGQVLTTTKGDDVVVLVVGSQPWVGPDLSIVDTAGLAFTQRAHLTNLGVWEFYARTESPLASDNFTVYSRGGLICPYCFQVLAVHGVSSRVFDSSPRFPLTVPSCPPFSCSASIGTVSHDFVIVTTAIGDSPDCVIPSGFTTLRSNGYYEVDYQIVVPTQTNLVFTCTGTEPISIVVDAISFHGSA